MHKDAFEYEIGKSSGGAICTLFELVMNYLFCPKKETKKIKIENFRRERGLGQSYKSIDN